MEPCVICKEPITLPYTTDICNHTFCLKCLHRVFLDLTDVNNKLKCPICRCSNPDNFTHNVFNPCITISPRACLITIFSDQRLAYTRPNTPDTIRGAILYYLIHHSDLLWCYFLSCDFHYLLYDPDWRNLYGDDIEDILKEFANVRIFGRGRLEDFDMLNPETVLKKIHGLQTVVPPRMVKIGKTFCQQFCKQHIATLCPGETHHERVFNTSQYWIEYFSRDAYHEHSWPPILYSALSPTGCTPALPGYLLQQKPTRPPPPKPLITKEQLDVDIHVAIELNKYQNGVRSSIPNLIEVIDTEQDCITDSPIFTLTSEPAMSAMLNNAPWITRTLSVTKAPRHEEIWDHKNGEFTRKLNLTTDTIYPRLTNNGCHTHTSKSTNGDYECTCYLNSCPIHHHLCSCIYPENTKVQCHCPLTCPLHTFPSMACCCVKWFCPFH